MSEAHAIEPEPLTQLVTWKQICQRYPDQWVALVDMDWNDEVGEFTVARIAGHGASRRAPFDQMRAAGLSTRRSRSDPEKTSTGNQPTGFR